MSFEDELRQSLAARAHDVAPDPALFARVQSRIRRGRTFRLALAGVAGAFALTGVALAAPTLMDRRVEFEPGPVGEQPASEVPTPRETDTEPAEVGAIGSAQMVFTDDSGLYSKAIDGESAEVIVPGCPAGSDCAYEPIAHVAARPAPRGAAVTGVAAGCGGVTFSGERPPLATELCPTSAVFSPDGRHLAYVAQADDQQGEWFLHTLDWTDEGPGGNEASFGLGVGADSTVRLDEWTWSSASDGGAKGRLYLRVASADGTMILRRPIERQGDGALALPPGGTGSRELFSVQNFSAVAMSSGGSAGDEYVLEVHVAGGAVDAAHIAGVDSSSLDLPATVFGEFDAEAIDGLWLTALDQDIVLGDGLGRAWTAHVVAEQAPVFVPLDGTVVHADLVQEVEAPALAASDPPAAQTGTQVDVFFGMAGADACVASQPVQREVEGPGVARGALTELLEGPTSRESNEGIETPFNANTAGALRDITISGGRARVDLRDFSGVVGTDSCTKSAILDSLDKTLRQFPTVTSTRYSFEGSTRAWDSWLGSDTEHPAIPPAVQETADRVRGAAQTKDYTALRRLSSETSCTLSDQKEPCVPVWKDQEANGDDPLGVLAGLLEGPPTRSSTAPMWVWPAEFADPSGGYSGPRVGIDEAGVWRYYVQEGG